MPKSQKNPVILLSNSHDVLVFDRKKKQLPSFQLTAERQLEFDIRDYLADKLKCSLASLLGVYGEGSNSCPVLLVDDSDVTTPKNHFWLSIDKCLGDSIDSGLLRDAYSQILLGGQPIKSPFSVWPMGDNELDSAILGALVASGKKTSCSSLLVEYSKGDTVLPDVGGESVIIDWSGRVSCIIKTLAVDIKPFDKVDKDHAARECLPENSLEYWQDVHWDLFSQTSKEHGLEPDDKMDVVCETFEVIKSFVL